MAGVLCCALLCSLSTAFGQERLAANFILKVGPAAVVNPQPNYVMEQPPVPREHRVRPTIDPAAYAAAKARAARSRVPGAVKPLTAAPASLAPTIKTINFNGHSDSEGSRPPDTHSAIGTTHFVEVTNSHLDMWDRKVQPSPGSLKLVKSVTLANFFGYNTETIFDPRVVYDSTYDRWIIVAEALAESTTVQRLFIGISTGPDPTKPFFIYNFDIDTFDNNDFFDFPQLGIDQDAVLITGNIFPAVGGFSGANFLAIAKARLYNGLGFDVPIFTGLAATLAPPIVLDQNASTFLIAAPTSGAAFTKYTATNTSHPEAVALVASTITVPSFATPPDARQPGTSDLLDTSDARFINASTQNGEDLWQTHTIDVSGFPVPKFYRINTTTNTVKQSGRYFVSNSSDDFNASITANRAGDCFVTYTSTNKGAGKQAQVRLSGKLNGASGISAGPLGFTSPTFYTPSLDATERWGDYSAVTVDPLNPANAWLINEKVNSNSAVWGSRIIRFGN
ncbi:MAG: hypothetical protein ABR589_00675 [Chthoniobacterales bacterium]